MIHLPLFIEIPLALLGYALTFYHLKLGMEGKKINI